ncbi:MAG TPA: CocE/NonD family hydrolase [Gemmatimonadaceae bacterium]|jgi:predicted acyl esterase|nr:CocE/NonD family hydrolase [Gemmatimonadaceae bacterium]
MVSFRPSHRVVAVLLAGALVAAPLAAQVSAGGPYPPPRGPHQVAIERSLMVPMRDGVRLATDIYRPAELTGPLPAILMRTPYNKQGNALAGNVFASNGYVVVVQDVRGKFGSEGEYRIYNGDMTDWSDAFDWIGHQPWSKQRIGSFGCSYLGEQQIIAAQQRHPLHIAAIPQAAGGNLGRVGRHRTFWGSVEGGANAVSINFGWMPVWASTDKGVRARPAVNIGTFLLTLPTIVKTAQLLDGAVRAMRRLVARPNASLPVRRGRMWRCSSGAFVGRWGRRPTPVVP